MKLSKNRLFHHFFDKKIKEINIEKLVILW